MTETERKLYRTVLSSRQETAYNRLKENTEYMQFCETQEQNDETVEELLHKLDKPDRLTIRRYYENETRRESFELDEVYLQGLQDGAKLLALLGVLRAEISM